MLTPQEVSEHAFARASFGGYNMAMVDEFLDRLTEDYTALYKENTVLKNKMKVLVDKVEEYRSTEEAMRKALLNAQRMADEIVMEASSQKREILKNAEQDARNRQAQLEQEIADQELRLASAQKATAEYIVKVRDLCRSEMEYLSGLKNLSAPAPEPDRVQEKAEAIEHAVEEAVKDTPVPASAPEEDEAADGGLYADLMGFRAGKESPAAPEEETDDTAPTKRIDFSGLQFGKDYEIK